MITTKIQIRNLFGIKEYTQDGGSVELSGKNGVGKTSVIDAIRFALTNKSEREYIVRKGETEGEILIETDTGLRINRKVRTDRVGYLKHGMAKSRIWNIWTGMRDRCSRPNNKNYQRYGGRGICVCPEWDSDFQNFYDWSMENGYSDDLTIDRIDNDGNYEPSNCRWVTRKEQTRNRSITKTIPLARIAEIDGITYQAAYDKYVRCNVSNLRGARNRKKIKV